LIHKWKNVLFCPVQAWNRPPAAAIHNWAGPLNIILEARIFRMEEKVRTLSKLFANHFTAQLDTVRLRTGKITERLKIDHPEAAAVLPFLDAENILMVRQWRYAIARETLEIPAGKADPGEDLLTCARRELLEETGYHARHIIPIFSYHPAIGYSNEVIQIYAAAGLTRVSETQDVDEISRLEIVPLAQLQDLIRTGVISDGKTVIGVSLFSARQAHGEIPADFFT
jgi:ADP-ribose pyrophosphatase